MFEMNPLIDSIRLADSGPVKYQGFMLVQERSRRISRRGDPFLTLRLADNTAHIQAVLFSNHHSFALAADPDIIYVAVRGVIEKNEQYGTQLRIEEIREVRDDDRERGFDEELLQPTTPYDIDVLWDELIEMGEAIGNEKLREAILALFTENEEMIRRWPAATRVHQAYLGGLLEHTVMVARDALYFAQKYPELHHDLLLSGALLHDMGKLTEIQASPPYDFTDDGRLIGHIVLGAQLARSFAEEYEVDEGLVKHLEHLILSHHGKHEYGAASLPKTREALVLHHIDNIDAKLAIYRRHVTEDANQGNWTERAWWFENQSLWKGKLPE